MASTTPQKDAKQATPVRQRRQTAVTPDRPIFPYISPLNVEPAVRRTTFYLGAVWNAARTKISGKAYIEMLEPAHKKFEVPILLIHGDHHTGSIWLNKPDGMPGWASYFLSEGFTVYIIDLPMSGRSMGVGDSLDRVLCLDADLVEQEFTAPARQQYPGWESARLHDKWPGTGLRGDAFFDMYFERLTPVFLDRTERQELSRTSLSQLLLAINHPTILVGEGMGGNLAYMVADLVPEFVAGVVAVEPIGPPFGHAYEDSQNRQYNRSMIYRPGLRPYGISDIPMAFDPPPSRPQVQTFLTDGTAYHDGDYTTDHSTWQPVPVAPYHCDKGTCWLPAANVFNMGLNENRSSHNNTSQPGSAGVHQNSRPRGVPFKLPNFGNTPTAIITAPASAHSVYDWATVKFLRELGVRVDHIELNKHDIYGNGHLCFLESNSLDIVRLIHRWLMRNIQEVRPEDYVPTPRRPGTGSGFSPGTGSPNGLLSSPNMFGMVHMGSPSNPSVGGAPSATHGPASNFSGDQLSPTLMRVRARPVLNGSPIFARPSPGFSSSPVAMGGSNGNLVASSPLRNGMLASSCGAAVMAAPPMKSPHGSGQVTPSALSARTGSAEQAIGKQRVQVDKSSSKSQPRDNKGWAPAVTSNTPVGGGNSQKTSRPQQQIQGSGSGAQRATQSVLDATLLGTGPTPMVGDTLASGVDMGDNELTIDPFYLKKAPFEILQEGSGDNTATLLYQGQAGSESLLPAEQVGTEVASVQQHHGSFATPQNKRLQLAGETTISSPGSSGGSDGMLRTPPTPTTQAGGCNVTPVPAPNLQGPLEGQIHPQYLAMPRLGLFPPVTSAARRPIGGSSPAADVKNASRAQAAWKMPHPPNGYTDENGEIIRARSAPGSGKKEKKFARRGPAADDDSDPDYVPGQKPKDSHKKKKAVTFSVGEKATKRSGNRGQAGAATDSPTAARGTAAAKNQAGVKVWIKGTKIVKTIASSTDQTDGAPDDESEVDHEPKKRRKSKVASDAQALSTAAPSSPQIAARDSNDNTTAGKGRKRRLPSGDASEERASDKTPPGFRRIILIRRGKGKKQRLQVLNPDSPDSDEGDEDLSSSPAASTGTGGPEAGERQLTPVPTPVLVKRARLPKLKLVSQGRTQVQPERAGGDTTDEDNASTAPAREVEPEVSSREADGAGDETEVDTAD